MTLLTILETTKALDANATNNPNMSLILLALIPGILAFILSIINAFRIRRVKKLHEVDLVNHKEDVNLSMEGVKVSLAKEINRLKKGVNKNQKTHKPAPRNEQGNEKGKETNKDNAKKVVNRRSPQQRSKNYRKRPQPKHNKPQDDQEKK
jgi:hypothetical protein